MTTVRHHKVVVIPGDGIGPSLVDAATLALEAAQARLEDFKLDIEIHIAGAGLYQREGINMTPETLAAVRAAGATMKGPVGLPEVRGADGTEPGLLGGTLRIGLDTYANLRPVRLLPGVEAPLKAKPGEIDYAIVRENTEGMYLSRGKGVGTDQAMSDTMLITRKGTERVSRYAFELARRRKGAPSDHVSRVTCVDKSNVLASFAFFRQVFDEVAAQFPDIQAEHLYADAAAEALVSRPEHFDVLVMENFLGDILSDLGGGTVGGLGMLPSGNIGDGASYFEPVHGSAPDIAGQDVANPISQVLTAALMLDHLGERDGAELIRRGVEQALATGRVAIVKGRAVGGTKAAGESIAAVIREMSPRP